MKQMSLQARARPVRESLDELAQKIRRERDSAIIRIYDYKVKDGYFSVSLTPVKKDRV